MRFPNLMAPARWRMPTAIVLAVMALDLAATASRAQTTYTLVPLATSVGFDSVPEAINKSGQVVGWQAPKLNPLQLQAVLWSGNRAIVLPAPSLTQTAANEINSAGEIVGVAYPSPPASGGPYVSEIAVFWNHGAMQVLPGGDNLTAYGVNDLGSIAGGDGGGPLNSAAVFWSGGVPTSLPGLGGSGSVANAINAAGLIVGVASLKSPPGLGHIHATLWNGGQILDLGALAGIANATDSSANSINNVGQVVGETEGGATIWALNGASATVIVLPPLPGPGEPSASVALGVNNLGQVVGVSGPEGGTATIWNGGVPSDLNTLVRPLAPNILLSSAQAINDSGEIAATGFDFTLQATQAYLLIPIAASPCRLVGGFDVCKLRPSLCEDSNTLCKAVCDRPCNSPAYLWPSPDSVEATDPWLRGIAVAVAGLGPVQGRPAAQLSVVVSTEPRLSTYSGRNPNAEILDQGVSKLQRTTLAGPLVELSSTTPEFAALPEPAGSKARPVFALSIPYDPAGSPGAQLRMVSFDAAQPRWVDVGAQADDVAHHLITARVSGPGRYSIVALGAR